MSKSMKNMFLLAKLHVTPDVDPVPTAADNCILARGVMPQLITAEYVERNNMQGFKGNSGSFAVGVHRIFEFEVELAGSGAAGTAPKWGLLLQACGFSETVLAATSVTYQPVSSGEPIAALYGYLDGTLFKMLNSKGTVSFELNSKQIPIMKFKFMGDYSVITDTVLPTGASFTGFQKPLTVGKVNTPTFTFFGFAAVCTSLSFDIANPLFYRDAMNAKGARSQDRKPTGSATIEMPTVATANFGEIARLGTEGALHLVHGLTAGHIIQFDMPKLQLNGDPSISDDNGTAMLNPKFLINPDAGNDELIVVSR